MTTPKMRTDAPLSPEQIRAIHRQHDELMRHRKYIRVRNIVRVVFWTLAAAAMYWFIVKTHALDDYTNTCEALGQVCK
jgi:hypothetical protein